MDTYIQELNIFPDVKSALRSIGFTKLSDLEGHNYITLAKKFPPNCNIAPIISELNPLGYLLPPENEISIYEITMSKRLQHILERNNIVYLSQLSSYPKEKIYHLRNMGEKTIEELECICNKYGIRIRSLLSLRESMDQYQFPAKLYPMLFENNISCIEDFNQRNSNDLYNICEQDLSLTMKVYYILRKNGIELLKWPEDTFIFEILSEKRTTLLWQELDIITVSQVQCYDQYELNNITSGKPSLSSAINAVLKSK